MNKENARKGFGLLGVLLVIIVIAAACGSGVYVYHKNHKAKTATSSTGNSTSTGTKTGSTSGTTQTSDPYAGWKTYSSTVNGVTFKYPASWTVPSGGEDQSGIEVHSPTANGYYLSLSLTSGTGQDVNQNFLGVAPGVTVSTLKASSGMQLYLVAQTLGSETTGLGLATTPGSGKTSFGILDNGGTGKDNVTMSVNLIPAGSGSGINNQYPLQTYQAQPDYQTILKIFTSLSYSKAQ